jgi:hypothetical protein
VNSCQSVGLAKLKKLEIVRTCSPDGKVHFILQDTEADSSHEKCGAHAFRFSSARFLAHTQGNGLVCVPLQSHSFIPLQAYMVYYEII